MATTHEFVAHSSGQSREVGQTTLWRILLVVLVILIGSGYVLYSKRARIATAILAHQVKPRLEHGLFKAEAPWLLRDIHADAAMLFEVGVADKVAPVIDGMDREGHAFIPVSAPRPILEAGSAKALLIGLSRNEPVCFDVDIDHPVAEQGAEAQLGIRRACLIAVPPTWGKLVGTLWIGWNASPSAAVEERTKVAISEAAMRFAGMRELQ
jgi:hypothetical protein